MLECKYTVMNRFILEWRDSTECYTYNVLWVRNYIRIHFDIDTKQLSKILKKFNAKRQHGVNNYIYFDNREDCEAFITSMKILTI